jgi:ribosomal protein S10
MKNTQFSKRYKLKITSFNLDAIKLLEDKLKDFSGTKIVKLPKKKRFTFIPSPHGNSKSKEHFSLFTYKRLVYIFLEETTQLSSLLNNLSNDLTIVITKYS